MILLNINFVTANEFMWVLIHSASFSHDRDRKSVVKCTMQKSSSCEVVFSVRFIYCVYYVR